MELLSYSYDFCISLLYLYLDEYDGQNGSSSPIPMIKDIEASSSIPVEDGKYVIHRGDSIMNAEEITNFYNSILMINLNKMEIESILECCHSSEAKVDCFSNIQNTSFFYFLTYFILSKTEALGEVIDERMEYCLRKIGRLLMKIVFVYFFHSFILSFIHLFTHSLTHSLTTHPNS